MRSGPRTIEPVVKRGEIYWVDLGTGRGSERRGFRPVLVIQNEVGNRYSPTTIVAALTTRVAKRQLPTHVELREGEGGLDESGLVLCEQLRTLAKERLGRRAGQLSTLRMGEVNEALEISLDLDSFPEALALY